MKRFVTPEYITGQEIKSIRTQLGLTQKEFAQFVNSSVPTIERWECSEKNITGPIVLLCEIIAENNSLAEELIVPEKEYPLRLWYMYNEKVCTIIDVDEGKRQVAIKNFTNKVMFRAFGKIEKPSYELYEEWLESRCFPRERDKMKLILKDLNIPFYDAMMIIEKTEGRMAEDDFWIKIER